MSHVKSARALFGAGGGAAVNVKFASYLIFGSGRRPLFTPDAKRRRHSGILISISTSSRRLRLVVWDTFALSSAIDIFNNVGRNGRLGAAGWSLWTCRRRR